MEISTVGANHRVGIDKNERLIHRGTTMLRLLVHRSPSISSATDHPEHPPFASRSPRMAKTTGPGPPPAGVNAPSRARQLRLFPPTTSTCLGTLSRTFSAASGCVNTVPPGGEQRVRGGFRHHRRALRARAAGRRRLLELGEARREAFKHRARCVVARNPTYGTHVTLLRWSHPVSARCTS